MNDNLISNVLNGVSDRHIRENEIELLTGGGKSKFALKLRIAMTAACAAAVFGIGLTAGAAATNGFTSGFTNSFNSIGGYDTWREQPTVEFSAASLEGAPEIIEQTYAPALLKKGVNYRKSVYMYKERNGYSIGYMQEIEDAVDEPFFTMNTMQLVQTTKARFREEFNTPKYVNVKEITVNGCPGFVISQERYSGTLNTIVWDNGEYIFRLLCTASEEEALRIAESVAPCDEQTGEVLS